MSNLPLVTWLMPTLNGMPYVRETLASIAGQTYRDHRILAWDNGSTDGTLEELRRWIPAHLPGRIATGTPLGIGASRAALIRMAETELCAVMDHDDIALRQRLELQVPFLLEHPEVVAVGGQADIIDENGVLYDRWTYKTDDAQARWMTRWHAQLSHSSVLYRRRAVLAAGNYRDVRPDDDLDLWMRLASMGEIRNLPETLVRHRRTGTNVTGKVEDFFPTDQQAAFRNAGILFPNIPDPRRAMELWQTTHPRQLQAPSRVRHIWQLEAAARSLAKSLGKPADYFTSTQVFEDQQYSLKTRAYERFGLMPLVRLRKQFAKPQPVPQSVNANLLTAPRASN